MRKHKARELVRFGENVRGWREGREWTQEQLAEKADLDQTYISGIERASRARQNETYEPWLRREVRGSLRECWLPKAPQQPKRGLLFAKDVLITELATAVEGGDR